MNVMFPGVQFPVPYQFRVFPQPSRTQTKSRVVAFSPIYFNIINITLSPSICSLDFKKVYRKAMAFHGDTAIILCFHFLVLDCINTFCICRVSGFKYELPFIFALVPLRVSKSGFSKSMSE
jgi:hypothetical protein